MKDIEVVRRRLREKVRGLWEESLIRLSGGYYEWESEGDDGCWASVRIFDLEISGSELADIVPLAAQLTERIEALPLGQVDGIQFVMLASVIGGPGYGPSVRDKKRLEQLFRMSNNGGKDERE